MCLVSQLTFQAFIVEYLHVLMWFPSGSVILMILLELTPSNSSFFSPWNLTTNKLIPYSGRDCHALIKFIFDSSRLRSLTLACDSSIFWRNCRVFLFFANLETEMTKGVLEIHLLQSPRRGKFSCFHKITNNIKRCHQFQDHFPH